MVALLLTCVTTGCPEGDPSPQPIEPDYSMPGDNGVMVNGEPVRGAEHHTDRVPPAMGECEATYTALATVRQQVFVCDNYEYGPLYDRAKVEAEYFAGQTMCPDQCPPVTWISHHRWGCVDITDPAIASASVEASVMCSLEQVTPESLPRPSDAELTGQDGIVGQPTQEPGLFDEIGPMFDVPCNATELATYSYHAPVASCDAIDYEPYVDQAEIMARQYHTSVSCSDNCVRAPFMTRRIEWSCEDENGQPTVVVRLLFDIVCTAP
jgi:hypothetical protein